MERNAGRRGAQMNSMPQSVIEFSSLYLHHLRSPRVKRARIEERERDKWVRKRTLMSRYKTRSDKPRSHGLHDRPHPRLFEYFLSVRGSKSLTSVIFGESVH